jgi:hypothetical protein
VAKSRKNKNNNVVYIILDGIEYKVRDTNGSAKELISATEPSLPKGKRLNMLDIKGLGLLKFRSRKIVRRRDKRKGLEYRLKFEQWVRV